MLSVGLIRNEHEICLPIVIMTNEYLINIICCRPHNNSMVYPSDDDGNDESEEMGEEADEVVPDGVEEVEQAKIELERRERETKVLIDDIRTLLSRVADSSAHVGPALQSDDNISWVVTGSRSLLVRFCMNLVIVRPSCP